MGSGRAVSVDTILTTFNSKSKVFKYISVCVILVELMRGLPTTDDTTFQEVLVQRYLIA